MNHLLEDARGKTPNAFKKLSPLQTCHYGILFLYLIEMKSLLTETILTNSPGQLHVTVTSTVTSTVTVYSYKYKLGYK